MKKTELQDLAFLNCKDITAENLSEPIIDWGQAQYFAGFMEGYAEATQDDMTDEEIGNMLEETLSVDLAESNTTQRVIGVEEVKQLMVNSYRLNRAVIINDLAKYE